MSKKYVIEIKPEYEDTTKGVMVLGARESNLYVDTLSIEHLEELNSDYINEHFGELQDEAYQRGLDDAMSAFKKLYSCGWERDWKAMGFEFNEGEWSTSFEYIIGQYTASEIVEKVNRIEVGDEVQAPQGKAIVTAVKDDYVHYFYSGGDIGCIEPCYVTKTGKHYDIQSILEAMKS